MGSLSRAERSIDRLMIELETVKNKIEDARRTINIKNAEENKTPKKEVIICPMKVENIFPYGNVFVPDMEALRKKLGGTEDK